MPITIPMPYGIPIPEELDFMEEIPEWPAQWANNQPVSSYYYVDGTHPNVQKVHNGTPDEPLDRIPTILGAGTLCVVRNLYKRDTAGKTVIHVNGTDGEWVAGYNGKAFVDFGRGEDRCQFFFKAVIVGKYGIVDGLTNDPTRVVTWQVGSSTELLSHDAHHIAVRNFKYTGDGISSGTAVTIAGPNTRNSNRTNYIVIYNTETSEFGDINYGIGEDIDANGMIVNGYATNIWILHNDIHHTSGAGIQMATTNVFGLTSHIYVGKNHIHDIAQAGVGMKYPSNVVISQNKIERCLDKHNTPSKGIGFQYAPVNIWILFNEILECRFGIRGAGSNTTNRPTSGWPIYAIGNVIDESTLDQENASYNLSHDSAYNNSTAIASMGSYHFYVANNLIMNSDVAFTSPISSEYYTIVNNIILRTRYDPLYLNSSTFKSYVNNNLFASEGLSLRRANSNFTRGLDDMETLVTIRDNLEFDDTYLLGLTRDEKIASLKELDILVDAGVDLPDEYAQIFEDTFGIPFARGVDDKMIPQGLVRDIGPSEYGDILIPVLPSSPSDFYISSSSKELIWSLNSINEATIEVHKDGILLEVLPKGTTRYSVPTILDDVNSYQVYVVNEIGSAFSEVIYSKRMTFALSAEDVNLDEATAYLMTREDKRLDSTSQAFLMPSASKAFNGVPFDKVSAYLNQDKISSGYIYLSELDSDDYISCDFTGEDKVTLVIVTNNSDSSLAGTVPYTFYVSLGDTVYTIVNEFGFQKFDVEFDIEGSSEVKITCKDNYSKGMIGVATMHTNTEPKIIVVDPDKLEFTYSIRSDGYTVDFVNPTGTEGTWTFGESDITTEVNPTHVFTNGTHRVQYTGANSQEIVIDVDETVVETNFNYTTTDNIVQFNSDGVIGTWDFGEGTILEAADPSKEFTIGNYGVSFNGGGREYININFDPVVTPVGTVTERIIATGDSITAAGDITGSKFDRISSHMQIASLRGPWTTALLAHTSENYIVEDNIGVSGYTTTNMLGTTLIDRVLESNATLVVLMLGVNDIRQGKAMSEIQTDYRTIVNMITATNKKVLIIPVSYTNEDGLGDTATNQTIDTLNAFLATLGTVGNKVKVAGVNSEYNTEIVSESLSVSRDGLHPNNRGGMLLGENVSDVLNTYYPSNLIKDSKIIGFEGTGGKVVGTTGDNSAPTGWTGLYGKSWEAEHTFNGVDSIKIVTSGVEGETIKNKIRLKLETLPTGLEEGWYLLEVKVQFENAESMQEFKLVAESTSSWGLSSIGYTTPVARETFKSGEEYIFKTLKMHIDASDGLSYVYVDAEQGSGDDVTMYLYEPKFYKVEDIE